MLEAKKDKLHIYVERTPLVGSCAVSVSFKTKLSECCINKLNNNCSTPCSNNCFPSGTEEACVAYAVFLAVQLALCGDPVATSKSKVGAVQCGYNNGSFSISWLVKGTGSAVRKSLGIALKCFAPAKLNSVYSHCVKSIGGKVNKDHFNAAADAVSKDMKDGICCGIIGNIKIQDAAVLNDMLDVLNKKLSIPTVSGSKSANKEHVACDHSEYTTVKATGWHANVLDEYIHAKLKGVITQQCDKHLLVNMKPAQWETASKKLKSGVSDYTQARYAKVGADMAAVMGYSMFSNATVSSHDVLSMLKANIKPSAVEKAIADGL